MSVPEPNRGEGELAVNTKCRQLVVYTLKILENEKWFPQEIQKACRKGKAWRGFQRKCGYVIGNVDKPFKQR